MANAGAVYARILRAILRGEGIRLTADELDASGIDHDDAAIMAAIGGDGPNAEPPEWLTPTERRRFIAAVNDADCEESLYLGLFRPGREVARG